MKKLFLQFCLAAFSVAAFAQSGSVLQGVGAVNWSMGGAATAQPLDISGALQWNSAAISTFDNLIIKVDAGLFLAAPEVSSSLPANFLGIGVPAISGSTVDSRGGSLLPSLALVWGRADSKHTFGLSAFGISGFGLTYPVETNAPVDAQGNPNPSFNPTISSNPVLYPQAAGGFGQIESDYSLFQIGLTYAYEISDKFSVGIEPTINFADLQLMPNPTTNPNAFGYSTSDKASAFGYGAQFGLYFDSGSGFKAGASYKTKQFFNDYEFNNTYPDGSTAISNFTQNFPSIISVGLGYSMEKFDFAADYRYVDYANTEGFAESGWTPTAAVAGFGWQSISIVSVGVQYKGIEKLPLRVGYTYNTNPVTDELAFFSTPFPAVVTNGFQFGLSFIANDNFSIDAVYHHGSSGDTSSELFNPQAIPLYPPLGSLPGSKVSYNMSTDLIMLGVSYNFNK